MKTAGTDMINAKDIAAACARLGKKCTCGSCGVTDRLKEHVLNGEMEAARKELSGEIVAMKGNGIPYDHVDELSNAQQGLLERITYIKALLAHAPDSPARSALVKELGEASRLLDKSEEYLPRNSKGRS